MPEGDLQRSNNVVFLIRIININISTVVLTVNRYTMFLISNFRRLLNVVCFLLGNSPASELYMPTFRNTLSVPASYVDRYTDRVFRNVGIYNSDAGELPRGKHKTTSTACSFIKHNKMHNNECERDVVSF